MSVNLLTATASDLQSLLLSNAISSKQLVRLCLDQISRHNNYLKAVIATTPQDILDRRTSELDDERTKGNIRGPLHGIPILLKDNIAVGPALGLPTTCGSLALVGSKPKKNAAVVDRLLAAGAIILGKANLSEWAWARSDFADSGWSAVGGQTQSAYVRGGFRQDDTNGGHSNPGGSSSGSAVAVAAGFSPISIGTETMGSLIMPSDRSALYTMKPTLKIVPQDGIVPVSYELDSAGPMTKSVTDLANLLDILVDRNKTSVPEGGYKSAVTGSWEGIRIGVVEPEKWLFPEKIVKFEQQAHDQMAQEWNAAYAKLKTLAKIVKPVSLLSIEDATDGGKNNIWNVTAKTFGPDLERYLATVDDCKINNLAELVEFNKQNSELELPPGADNQNALVRALNCTMTDDESRQLVDYARNRCGKHGIDKLLEDNDIDVIIGPGDGPMFHIPSSAGYPEASLPLGYLNFNGRPFGLQVFAKPHQEALLIQVQSAWEASFPARQPPSLYTD